MDKLTIKDKEEIDEVVKDLDISELYQIGSRKWFNRKENVIKLYKLIMIQAKNGNDSLIKDIILKHDKVNFFVTELITLFVWREKVLSEMFKLSPDPMHTFPTYIILYHEGMILGMLQALLYHNDICSSLGELARDLVDYAVGHLNALLDEDIKTENAIDSTKDIIKSQQKVISFNIAAQCIPVLRYICEYLDDLPLCVSSSIYSHHDIPMLVTRILYNEVWIRKRNNQTWKFDSTSWRQWYPDDPVLSSTECQTWLLIYQILTHKNCTTNYELTSYRKSQLSKVIPLLSEPVIDMLSPLKSLKEFINLVQLEQSNLKPIGNCLIIDMDTRLYNVIDDLYKQKYKNIAVEQSKLLFYGSQSDIQDLAISFTDTYCTLDKITDILKSCHNCYAKATKKCSKCKRVYYCSKDCQIQHWNAHKTLCLPDIV